MFKFGYNKFFYINKIYKIEKKLKNCLNCHNINKINNTYPNINKNIKYTYKNLLNFKEFNKFNSNMNYIIKNIKNKYIIEMCKFLKIIPNIYYIFINFNSKKSYQKNFYKINFKFNLILKIINTINLNKWK